MQRKREKEAPRAKEDMVCNSQSKGVTDTPAKNCLHTSGKYIITREKGSALCCAIDDVLPCQ